MSMSKISDKSLIAARLRAFWKRFEGLGTGFARRYRFDLFFRTETNIVLLQTGFVLFVLALVIAAIFFAYDTISHNLTLGIAQILTTGAGATTTSVTAQVHYLRDQNIIGI